MPASPYIKKRMKGEASSCDIKRPPACPALGSKAPDEGLDQTQMSWEDLEEQLTCSYMQHFTIHHIAQLSIALLLLMIIALLPCTITTYMYTNYKTDIQVRAATLYSQFFNWPCGPPTLAGTV